MSQTRNIAGIRQMMGEATGRRNEYNYQANETVQSLQHIEEAVMGCRTALDMSEVELGRLERMLKQQSVRLAYFAQEVGIIKEGLRQ